jgi:hypothetical protein
VTWNIGLLDPHPVTDRSSSTHPEDPHIEDVGELIAAPNPSSVELRSFNGKVWSIFSFMHLMLNVSQALRYPSGCHSFSDRSSFIVSLHDFEDASLSSGNCSLSDHDEVLVSPVSDLPHGGEFPPNPRGRDSTEKGSALEATLMDHTPEGGLDGGELSEHHDIANSMFSIAKVCLIM